MVLAIVGSHKLKASYKPKVLAAIAKFLKDHPEVTKIISGGAKNVDSLAKEYADMWHIPFEAYKPKVPRWWGPGGYRERNIVIAEKCDMLFRIYAYDTKTYGSGWTADYAAKLGKSVFQEKLDEPTTTNTDGSS